MDYRDYNPNHDDTDVLYQALKILPKIELHRHLEGSLRLQTMAEIAREHGLELPGYTVSDFYHLVQMTTEDEANAEAFIAKFNTLRLMYRSPEYIKRIAYEVVVDAASENIIYLELRFTPIALGRVMDFPLADVADWVIDAVEQAKRDFPIDVRLIVSMNRHEAVEIGDEMVKVAIANMHRGVAAIDLAGAENRFPGEPFGPVFRKGREAGLGVTIHAGEWAGPDSVIEAVTVLGAARLGHGVRTIESETTLEMVRDRGITLEVCPTSNIQSGVAQSYETHPLRELYKRGIRTTLNTDDPSICGINLTDELAAAVRYMNFSLGDLRQHVINAAQAAFLPENERKVLAGRIESAWGEH